jgi:phosphate uptake regulator
MLRLDRLQPLIATIGIESPLHIVGKSRCQDSGGHAGSTENIAKEVLALKGKEIGSETNEIAKFAGRVTEISKHSFKAFLNGQIKPANEMVEIVHTAEDDARKLIQQVLTYVKEASVATNLRIMISNLSQIAK